MYSSNSSTKHVLVGDSVSLSCMFDGAPVPMIRWFYNDAELVDDTINNVEVVSEDGWSVLRLSNVSLENEGNYRCEANNSLGVDSENFFLTVFAIMPSEFY